MPTILFAPRRLSPDDYDDLANWLASVPSLPLLTAEQEAIATRDQLVEHNLRLAVAVARKYAGRGMPISDLIQEGCIGLMRAAQTFDASKGRFSTHASPIVSACVSRALENGGNTIRIPVHIHEKHASTRPETVQAAIIAQQISSLDKELPQAPGVAGHRDDSHRTLADIVQAPSDTEAEALVLVEQQEQAAIIQDLLAHLDPRERHIAELRYVRGLTCEEAALELGCTKQRVHQIETYIRKQLTVLYITNRPAARRLSKCTCGPCTRGDTGECLARNRWRARHPDAPVRVKVSE